MEVVTAALHEKIEYLGGTACTFGVAGGGDDRFAYCGGFFGVEEVGDAAWSGVGWNEI